MQIREITRPIHPSALLQRELDARNFTLPQAATSLGVSTQLLQAVLDGGPVTQPLADALNQQWGTPAAVWTQLQRHAAAHPTVHGGAREGAGRPTRGLMTAQIRITGEPAKIEAIQAWIAAQGKGHGAAATAEALYTAIQRQDPHPPTL